MFRWYYSKSFKLWNVWLYVVQPLLASIGINTQVTVALIFGFIAKEIVLGGLAVIYDKSESADLMYLDYTLNQLKFSNLR